MTITIIGKSPAAMYRQTCFNCASILQFTVNDTHTKKVLDYGGGSETVRYIECPSCGNHVTVDLSKRSGPISYVVE